MTQNTTKRVLYNFWGYLSDKKGISSADGCATYVSWILGEFMDRGWEVYCGPIDRDKALVDKYGKDAFSAFSQDERWSIYNKLKFVTLDSLPSIDLLFLEWRFPTAYNQKSPNETDYSPDLEIQNKLIDNYKGKCDMVVFDLDYKFTEEDRKRVNPKKVLEQGLFPKPGNTTVFIPVDMKEMHQFNSLVPFKYIAYIGNDYNRRDDIEKKLIPFSITNPGKIYFYGNWLKDDQKEIRDKWNCIDFNSRVGFGDFREIYSRALCFPILATQEYKEHGHMTARILEGLMFGSIPIGWDDFKGIENWLPKELIINENNSIFQVYDYLNSMGFCTRMELRDKLINNLKFHDVKNFVDEVLK